MKKIYEKPAVAVIQYATSQMLATSWQVGDGETKPVIEDDPDGEINSKRYSFGGAKAPWEK